MIRERKLTSATSKARKAWGNMALETRTEVRSMGLRGEEPTLDKHVAGRAGVKGADNVEFIARTMRRGKLSKDRAARMLYTFVDDVVNTVYSDHTAELPSAS